MRAHRHLVRGVEVLLALEPPRGFRHRLLVGGLCCQKQQRTLEQSRYVMRCVYVMYVGCVGWHRICIACSSCKQPTIMFKSSINICTHLYIYACIHPGNFVNRAMMFVKNNCDGKVPEAGALNDADTIFLGKVGVHVSVGVHVNMYVCRLFSTLLGGFFKKPLACTIGCADGHLSYLRIL